jgi:hypothetical protein
MERRLAVAVAARARRRRLPHAAPPAPADPILLSMA